MSIVEPDGLCVQCRTKLTEASKFCPLCGLARKEKTGMMKCPYCAEEIQEGAQKCRYCNEWLTKPATIKADPPKRSKAFWLFPFFILGAMIFAISLGNNSSNNTSERSRFAEIYQSVKTRGKKPQSFMGSTFDGSKTTATATGVDNRILKVENPDYNSVIVNIEHESLRGNMDQLRERGFNKVVFANYTESWEFAVE